MSTLAGFIKQCLTEEKYGHKYINELEDRIKTLNYVQLRKMHEVLTSSSKDARVHVWKDANESILEPVTRWLSIRKEEYETEKTREEEIRQRIRKKVQMKEIKRKEAEEVIRQLTENAYRDAEVEIREMETQKRSEEKLKLLKVLPIAEERRNKYIKIGLAMFLIGFILTFVVTKIPYFIAAGIGFVSIISISICYCGFKLGKIEPYEENEDAILQQIEQRSKELYLKSINALKEKEAEFENKMIREKEERQQRRRERREKEMIEAALKAEQRRRELEDIEVGPEDDGANSNEKNTKESAAEPKALDLKLFNSVVNEPQISKSNSKKFVKFNNHIDIEDFG